MSSSSEANTPPSTRVTFTTVTTNSAAETEAVGEALADRLRSGDVVALEGPLGAGKTCLVRGLARGLGARDAVTSPTFTLIREYDCRPVLRHVDLYRLASEEVRDLAGRDLFHGPVITALEWAERAEGLLPRRRYRVVIEPYHDRDPDTRLITIEIPAADAAWDQRAGRHDGPERGGPSVGRRRVIDLPEGLPALDGAIALDTSTASRSLAVLKGGRMIEESWNPEESDLTAENLIPHLRGLMEVVSLKVAEIALLAVSRGPGSFTGIKVGLTAAKAMAYALGCPLVGVSTLDVLGAAALRQGDAALVLIDARRGEVYGAAYGRGTPTEPVGGPASYLLGPAADIAGRLYQSLAGPAGEPGAYGGRLVLAGSGAREYDEAITGALEAGPASQGPGHGGEPRRLPVLVRGPEHPRASDLLITALERCRAGRPPDDPFVLEPLYLKDPVAATAAAGNETGSRGGAAP